jgi:hypothetical protein
MPNTKCGVLFLVLSLFIGACASTVDGDRYQPIVSLARVNAIAQNRLNHEASIVVDFYVNENGHAKQVNVRDSKGLKQHEIQDIVNAFYLWKFKPASKKKIAYSSHWLATYEVSESDGHFELDEQEIMELSY